MFAILAVAALPYFNDYILMTNLDVILMNLLRLHLLKLHPALAESQQASLGPC